MDLHDFKKKWVETPTFAVNQEFLFWLLKRIEGNATYNASPQSAIAVIKENNAICEDFASTQEYYVKSFKVDYDEAELIDESAFRVFVPSMFKDPHTCMIWECLAWHEWRNDSSNKLYKNETFEWFLEHIKDPDLKWREYLRVDQIEGEEIEVKFVGDEK